VSRYEWLLFLHLLFAFALMGSVVVFTTVLLGARQGTAGALRLTPLARRLSDIGGTGTLVLGVWLALDEYDLLDGWIVTALVLWVVGALASVRLGGLFQAARDEGGGQAGGQATLLYAVTALAVLALLVVMIYKPGA
jgi:uncharacterized membrane protein